jgi:hypothetical protein
VKVPALGVSVCGRNNCRNEVEVIQLFDYVTHIVVEVATGYDRVVEVLHDEVSENIDETYGPIF